MPHTPAPQCNASGNLERRTFLKLSGLAALGAGLGTLADAAGIEPAHSLTIESARVELQPGHWASTLSYNARPVGPLIRARTGRMLRVDVHNQTGAEHWIHWHAQNVPRTESRIAAGATRRIHFIPDRPGLFFYHSGQIAAGNLNAGLYSSQVGALLVESPTTRIAQQRVWVLKDFGPELQRGARGFEVGYSRLTLNGRPLDAASPELPAGEPVLVHVLNASATQTLSLAVPGYSFNIAAVDGNALPAPAKLPRLILHPGERISAWLKVGHTARCTASPAPGETLDYAIFGSRAVATPDYLHDIELARHEAARSGFNSWSIHASRRRMAADEPLLQLTAGRRYRLRIRNTSEEIVPLHLQRHRMEVVKVGGTSVGGVLKDVVAVGPRQCIEVDVSADSPGTAEIYCTRQLQRDFGLRALIQYRPAQGPI